MKRPDNTLTEMFLIKPKTGEEEENEKVECQVTIKRRSDTSPIGKFFLITMYYSAVLDDSKASSGGHFME